MEMFLYLGQFSKKITLTILAVVSINHAFQACVTRRFKIPFLRRTGLKHLQEEEYSGQVLRH